MSGNKLLLADDSITIQKVVQLTFADEGVDVSVAADGDMAILKFAESAPDIVLADVHMPGLNGYEVCERIKQGDRKVPVILLVGSFEPFDSDRAHQAGADAFLTKPFQSIRQLVDIVSNLLAADGNETIQIESPVAPAAPADHDVDEFADTHDLPGERDTADLGDAGFDDEMIETTPAENFMSQAAPENSQNAGAQAFYDQSTADSMEDTLETEIPAPELTEENPASEPEYEISPASSAYDTPETQGGSFPVDTAAASAVAGSDSYGFEPADETPQEEGSAADDTETAPTAPSYGFEIVPEPPRYEAPPVYTPPAMDDTNLLEIPAPAETIAPAHEEILEPAREAATGPTPEFVEAVTQRVMERMNDDFFMNIIREIVPAVVREIEEDKMGE